MDDSGTITVVPEGTQFHTGFPSYTMTGPMTYAVYQVRLTSGLIVQAICMGELVARNRGRPSDWMHFWVQTDQSRTRIPVDHVQGWRDDTVCADYALAIARWAWEPFGVVNKGEWAHALGRHIANREGDTLADRVTCESCARKFVQAWVAKRGEIPEGWEAFA